MKRLYARFVLWLIRPALNAALAPDGMIWTEFERGGPGGQTLNGRTVIASIAVPSRPEAHL